MRKLIFILVVVFPFSSFGQHSLKIGTQFPVQYAIQYDYQFHPRWSAHAQIGVLTKPYDQIILEILSTLGTDQEIVNVLSSAFSFGVVTQVGSSYHFGKNYVGVLGSWVHLSAADTPISAIEAAFDVSVSSYPTRPRQSSLNPIRLTLASNLFNVGILYGRRFTFSNPKIEIHTEFSFAKTIGSYSYVESQQRSLESLSVLVDTELKTIYHDYGFLPSVNVFFVYKFL